MLPLDQFCPTPSPDHVFEASPDRRSVIFSSNGATWSYAFGENTKTKKLADVEAVKIRYLNNDNIVVLTRDGVAKFITLTVIPHVEDLYTGVTGMETRPGGCGWFLLEDGTSAKVDTEGIELEQINAWVVLDPDCRVIGHYSNGVFSFFPDYRLERSWSDYVTGRITPDGRAVEVTFLTHDWRIETVRVAEKDKKPLVSIVLDVTIPRSMVDPHLTVDRRAGIPAFVYGFDTELFMPKTITLHKSPGVSVITKRLTDSTRVRGEVDILDKASALVTMESLISDKRSSLSVPSSRSGNGMADRLLPVPANTPMWAAPGYVLTGEVIAADGGKTGYILHGFSQQGNPNQPTVVVVGDDSTLSGRFSPTASAVLRAGFNLLVVRPAIRYEKQGFGTVSNISVADAAYDVDDVIVHLRKTGKISKAFMIGTGHSADSAVVLASIVDSAIDGVIAIDAPLNTLLLEQSKPVGCNILTVEHGGVTSQTMDRFESLVKKFSGKRVRRAGSVFGLTNKTYGSLRRRTYDRGANDDVIRDIFSFISTEAAK